MIELSNFYSLLENATTVDEEVFDIRFEEIVSLVDQEKFDEATILMTNVLNEGTVDIRLVMYLLYTHFIACGITCLKDVFPLIITMINQYWEKISPINMREKYLLNSLTWFLSSIGKKLKRSEKLFKEKKADDFWNKSVSPLSHDDIKQLIHITHEFADFLMQEIKQPSLNQYIMFISKWLGSLRNIPHEQKVEEEKTLRTPTPAPKAQKETPKKQLSLKEILIASEPMTLLFRKIQAFETLIEKKDFEKAALVSDDISQAIKNFDPSVFFPKLFSRYFAQSAAHIDDLSQEWENKGSLKWDALNRLYQTDLDEFIQW